jgi:hypothetical protein
MAAHDDSGKPTARTMRRALRREVPSTVGLLADQEDFAAMRRYGSFTFDDHPTYLHHLDAVLEDLACRGLHTTVALFDPEEYAAFCHDEGHDPDTPASRARFTAAIAAGGGAALTYREGPVAGLVPALIDRALRLAIRDCATAILDDVGACADCGQDIGSAAFDHASHLLVRLLERAGPGEHQLVCSVPAAGEQLIAVLRAGHPGDTSQRRTPAMPGTRERAEFLTVLAVGIALDSTCGLVMRSTVTGGPDRLYGWRLAHGRLVPLTAAEVFNAYCTDAETGEPIGPESGVDYRTGFDLGPGDPAFDH